MRIRVWKPLRIRFYGVIPFMHATFGNSYDKAHIHIWNKVYVILGVEEETLTLWIYVYPFHICGSSNKWEMVDQHTAPSQTICAASHTYTHYTLQIVSLYHTLTHQLLLLRPKHVSPSPIAPSSKVSASARNILSHHIWLFSRTCLRKSRQTKRTSNPCSKYASSFLTAGN